ncbi:hypothetical protein TorRG33x02_059630 [Trema orientale]|uniref:Uncharacterized protein n=1 Tax=Trema orientale TaxID=63057 RepID=A0A2P5FK28_TREOI|nr:hypothetical protein TorRG33x02_059630 [Trema orientale]
MPPRLDRKSTSLLLSSYGIQIVPKSDGNPFGNVQKSDGKSNWIGKNFDLGLMFADSQNPILGSDSAFFDSRGLLADGTRVGFDVVPSPNDPSLVDLSLFKVGAADPLFHGSDLADVGKPSQADSTYGQRSKSRVIVSPTESGRGKTAVDSLGLEQNTRLHVVGGQVLDAKIGASFSLDGQGLEAKSDSKLLYAHISNQVNNGDLQVSNEAPSSNFGADGKKNSGSAFEDIPLAGNGLSLDKSVSGIGASNGSSLDNSVSGIAIATGLQVDKSHTRQNVGLFEIIGNSNVPFSHN